MAADLGYFADDELYVPQADEQATFAALGPLERWPVEAGGMPDDPLLGGDGMSSLLDALGDLEGGADWGSEDPSYHDANLAQFLPQAQCDRLAQKVIEWVSRDKQSRRDWEWREAEGLRSLGLSKDDLERLRKDVQPWQSIASHPGLLKGGIQFWARAFTELFPAAGPAKTVVLGATDQEKEDQATRVAGYLNWLYTQDMPGAYDEAGRSLFLLPMSGSHFRKAFYDPLLGALRVVGIDSADFVKPFSATDLRSAPRYCHLVRITRNDLNRAMAMGFYLALDLSEPEIESADGPLGRAQQDATGIRPVPGSGESEAEYDSRDLLYEMSVTLDLADYGWEDPLGEYLVSRETGRRKSIGVPYLVTVHHNEQKTLSIRRDWRALDQKKQRRRNVVEYKFLPGLKGYGLGLFHIAADTKSSQDKFLRSLIDARTLGILGAASGYVSNTVAGALNGLPPLKIGEYQSVSASADELAKAFFSPKVQDRPDETLAVLQYLDGQLDFLINATEAVVGDDNKSIPVGTMLARKEERTLPFQAIFRGLHASLAEELRAVAELAADYLDPAYPYRVEGEDREVFAEDFDERVDVVPVSDANYVSQSQRMQQAQFVLEEAAKLYSLNASPETWGPVKQAYRYLLETLRVPNPDRFMPVEQAQMPQTQPAAPDPAQADIARKDAQAQADIVRKDTLAQAEIARRAELQRADAQRRAQADRALIGDEADDDMTDAERELAFEIAARRMSLGEGAMPA